MNFPLSTIIDPICPLSPYVRICRRSFSTCLLSIERENLSPKDESEINLEIIFNNQTDGIPYDAHYTTLHFPLLFVGNMCSYRIGLISFFFLFN